MRKIRQTGVMAFLFMVTASSASAQTPPQPVQLDPTASISSPQLQANVHKPLPEQYIWMPIIDGRNPGNSGYFRQKFKFLPWRAWRLGGLGAIFDSGRLGDVYKGEPSPARLCLDVRLSPTEEIMPYLFCGTGRSFPALLRRRARRRGRGRRRCARAPAPGCWWSGRRK